MSSLLKKIIFIFILTMVLWGGVGLFGVKSVWAQTSCTDNMTTEEWKTCRFTEIKWTTRGSSMPNSSIQKQVDQEAVTRAARLTPKVTVPAPTIPPSTLPSTSEKPISNNIPIVGNPVSNKTNHPPIDGLTQEEVNSVWDSCGILTTEKSLCYKSKVAEILATKAVCQEEEKNYEKDRANPEIKKIYMDCLKGNQEKVADNPATQWFEGLKETPGFLVGGALKIVLTTLAFIYQMIIIPVLGALVRITAAMLDLSIQFTLNSKNISDVNTAIETTWAIIRNIFNITFIFILLYTAIKTIIGSKGVDTKKTIANVIIAALLINFSLFITRIVIDAGNILAVALYNAATTTSTGSVISMSSAIANSLGLGSVFATSGITCTFCATYYIVSIIQSAVMLSAIVILSYVALVMLVRSIVLIFLMVLSPIGFMGDIIPKISEYSKMWRENLYNQVLVAPVFLIFFYLIIQIGNKLNPGNLIGQSGENANYSAYFKYILILILLFIAAKMTKKLSGEVGGMVEKFGTMAAGAAVGYATGGASLLMKQTVGRGAAKLASNGTLAETATQKGIKGFGARMAIKGSNAISKKEFDVRNTSVFKETADMIGSQTGIKVNYDKYYKNKDGYQGVVKQTGEKAEEMAKLINKGDVKINDDVLKAKVAERESSNREELKKKEEELKTLQSIPEERLTEDKKKKKKKLEEETKVLKENKITEDSVREELEKTEKDRRIDSFASRYTEEEGIPGRINKLSRNRNDRKAIAEKIRKATKPKDFKTLSAEALKQKEKEDAEEAKKKADGEETY